MEPLTCSLTGEIAYHPVICKSTGYVFEKKLIEKLLQADPICPFTFQPLNFETDFVEIKAVRLSTGVEASKIQAVDKMQSEIISKVETGDRLKQIAKDLQERLRKELKKQSASISLIKKLTEERNHLRSKLTVSSLQLPNEGRVVKTKPSISSEIENESIRLNQTRKELSRSNANVEFNLQWPDEAQEIKMKIDEISQHTKILGFHPFSSQIGLLGGAKGSMIVVDFDEMKHFHFDSHVDSFTHRFDFCPRLTSHENKLGYLFSKDKNIEFYSVALGGNAAATRSFGIALEEEIFDVSSHPLERATLALTSDNLAIIDMDSQEVATNIPCLSEGFGTSDKKHSWLEPHPDGKLIGWGGEGKKKAIQLVDLVRGEGVLTLESELVSITVNHK